jgi:hypothetical protein
MAEEKTKVESVEVTFRLTLEVEMGTKPSFVAYTFITITDVPKTMAESDAINVIGKQAAANFREGLKGDNFIYLSYSPSVTDSDMHLVNPNRIDIITVTNIEKVQ